MNVCCGDTTVLQNQPLVTFAEGGKRRSGFCQVDWDSPEHLVHLHNSFDHSEWL